ncbi:MAG TPA: hypothetical protein VMU22_00185 [Rhizomicrobium sp.]|nr:hypothetical protein [Rhizomicrobium sp.]
MSGSRNLAALIGPCLVAITASEAANLRIVASEAPAVVYLDGAILFVAGLAIVRAHNVWTWRWPVAITIVGWLAAALGLRRMFLPDSQLRALHETQYGAIATAFAVGCFLTFKAYIGKNREGD